MTLTSSLKSTLRQVYLKFFIHDSVQQPLQDIISHTKQNLGVINNEPCPYFDENLQYNNPANREDIIFITSRFRSGSTLLWNIFRQIETCTSYYEPFNERRWFDIHHRGAQVDSSHIGVSDYSREYDNLYQLSHFYNEDWIRKRLFMDARSWDPQMKSYICAMVQAASGRPVLQFNRIDFRLPWLKHHFPNAKFIHLYRHPRDQWLSFLTDKALMSHEKVLETYQDAFYLNIWCRDLSQHFPFLDHRITPHPYQRFYYLWKLSYLYGKRESDISISFEQLVGQPKQVLTDLFNTINIDKKYIEPATEVLDKPAMNKWQKYADNDWFISLEQECERNLDIFMSARSNK